MRCLACGTRTASNWCVGGIALGWALWVVSVVVADETAGAAGGPYPGG